MGNSSRKPQDYTIVRTYRKQDWYQYQCTQTCQLWRNTITADTVQVFKLYTIPSIEDLNRYEWRRSQQDLVKVYHIALDLNEDICSKIQYVRLLIEYIPFRLSEVSNLNLEEALTILATAFRAFHALEENFEPVEPNEELIGFNESGKPKIWINKNTNINFANKNYALPYDNSSIQVCSRVRKIFDMVEQKTQNNFLPPYLKDQFRLNNPDYKKALSIIEQFSRREQIILNKCMQPHLFHKKNINQEPPAQNFIINRSYTRNQSCFITNQQLITNQSIPQNMRELRKHLSVGNFNIQGSFDKPVRMSFNQNHQIHIRDSAKFGNFPFVSTDSNLIYQPVTKINFVKSNNEPSILKADLTYAQPLPTSPSNIASSTHRIVLARRQSTPLLNQSTSQGKGQIIIVNPQHQIINHQIITNNNFNICPSNTTNINKIFSKPKPISPQNIAKFYQKNDSPSKNSIIDKVANDNYKEQTQQKDIQLPLSVSEEQQIKASATFTPITDKATNEEYSNQIQTTKLSQKQIKMEAINTANAQIPINFQSFAPDLGKLKQNELVSFAPMETNIETDRSVEENVNGEHSCKSVEYNENQNEQQTPKLVQSGQQLITSQEAKIILSDVNQENRQHDHPRTVQSEEERRFSIEGHDNREDEQYYYKNNPYNVRYTPVESKFDIIKRDSIVSREQIVREDRNSSALDRLDSDDLESYIRKKYDSFINDKEKSSVKVRVSRVSSQYHKYKVSSNAVSEEEKQPSIVKDKVKQHSATLPPVKPMKNNISITDKVQNTENVEEDYLDVNFLEKSLDKRYNSQVKKNESNTSQRENQKETQRQDDDELSVAKLDEELMKFSTSRISQSKTDKPKQEKVKPKKPPVSRINLKSNQEVISEGKDWPVHEQVSKVSLDYKDMQQRPEIKIFNEQKVEIKDKNNLNQTNCKKPSYQQQKLASAYPAYKHQNYQQKYYNYQKERQYPLRQISKANNQFRYSRISKDLTNKIQEKYNKYVKTHHEKRPINSPYLNRSRSRQIANYQSSQLDCYREDKNMRSAFTQSYVAHAQDQSNKVMYPKRGMGERKVSYNQLRSLLWK